ncbi:MAG: 23S rRNA (guanosine(2251)-2'-O)-methyltransferase RlmB [Deltaproteobacteria bacterium]|nr:23S rRNA (guanosine(2251)-2'-O)-methyltransferase RlmB [Deltaproteobacteria bacterium]
MKRRFFVNQRGGAPASAGHCVYGVHAVSARLAAAPPQVQDLMVREQPSTRLAALVAAATRHGVPVRVVPAAALRELCGSDEHQGVVARVPPFRYADLEAVLARGCERVLVLDHLRDPHNFGALLRTAEAAGVGAVVIPKDGAVGVTAAVEKAAAGAALRVPVALVVNVARTLQQLQAAGYWIIGLAANAGSELFEFDPPPRLAIVLGGEAGLRRLVQEQCDVLLRVPMTGQTESLNASVAGALAMYALRPRNRPT